MKWLKDFFFCDTWSELLAMSVLAGIAMIVFWFLLALVFALFG
jgi:hypothetical protein